MFRKYTQRVYCGNGLMEDNDLKKLADKIEAAKQENEKNPLAKKEKEESSVGMAFRAGTEIVAGVFIGYLVGKQLDSWFETSPIFLIVSLIVGFIAGFINIYRAIAR